MNAPYSPDDHVYLTGVAGECTVRSCEPHGAFWLLSLTRPDGITQHVVVRANGSGISRSIAPIGARRG